MTAKSLISAIGSIDDRYVLEYTAGATPPAKPSVKPIIRWSAAACAAVAAVAAAVLIPPTVGQPGGGNHTPPVTIHDGGYDPLGTTTTATPSKDEPAKPTTTLGKLLITADEPEDYGNMADAGLVRGRKYISPALQEKMKLYEGVNVSYAVIVEVPYFGEDYEEFWESTEELAQFYQEYQDVLGAFEEEVLQHNPSWDGNVNHIKVWTKEMRANYEYGLTLIEKRRVLEEQYRDLYNTNILNKRVQVLEDLKNEELISLVSDTRFYPFFSGDRNFAFFMELSRADIDALAEYGCYVIRLMFPEGDKDIALPE